jgi:hypothetical protein
MRKNKAMTLIATAAFAAGAKVACADTDLFSTLGDFGGSSDVINAAGQGYVGGDINAPYTGIGPVPTAASLAAGQEVGYEGLGYYSPSGDVIHPLNGDYTNPDPTHSYDSKGDNVAFVPTSLGNAGPATNGIGHYANDFGASTDVYQDGYPTEPAVTPPALPTVAAPFNSGRDRSISWPILCRRGRDIRIDGG